MATQVDAAALLVYPAAWLRDRGNVVTKEAAIAELAATEGATEVQQLIIGRELLKA